MELRFPFKNWTINDLLGFLSKENILDFILTAEGRYSEKHPWGGNYFETRIEQFKENLPNYENELLQIINTSNQETIDFYFEELRSNLEYIFQEFELENVKSKIENWNNEELKRYYDEVEKETEKYFESEDRKREHLEEYESYEFLAFFLQPLHGEQNKVKKINYNFYCIDKTHELIDESYTEKYHEFLMELLNEANDIARRYGIPWSKGEVKAKHKGVYVMPVVFVEGEHDITYIKKAAEVLGKTDILEKVDLRQRGGYTGLDKIWAFYKENNWETISQRKLLLYDCDTRITDEESGNTYKRIIKIIPENIITKGIENLFPNTIVEKAMIENPKFIDITRVYRTKRGEKSEEIIYIVNGDEKKNFCKWICENSVAEDFASFNPIFEMILLVLDTEKN